MATHPHPRRRRHRLRLITLALALCAALGLVLASPLLATTTVLRTELIALTTLLTGDNDRDLDIAEHPELAADIARSLQLDPAWIQEVAAATDIPERALTAYAVATLAIEDDYPGCGIGWNTLAAIGSVESYHGAIHGSSLGDDGVATPSIFGPALDGGQFKGIPDSDGGTLDGDTQWDRAVGPMQFIPQTWQVYGRDANGDGISDPQNIDDAALSAAAYLCAAGGDLTSNDNWIAAIHAYNQSIEYNHAVVDAANRYATAHR